MSERMFAYRKRHTTTGIFSRGEPREHIELGAVAAESLEDARDAIISHSNVASLTDGVTLEIIPVSFSTAQVFHAQYNGDPFYDHSAATDVELVVGPLL